MYQPHLLVLEYFDPLLLVLDVMRIGHKHSSPWGKTKGEQIINDILKLDEYGN
jgi:hypothetical protein